MKNKMIVSLIMGGMSVLLLVAVALQVKAQDDTAVYLPLVLGKALPPPSGWVVFGSDRDGDQEIYRMRYDGSEVTQLTFNTSSDAGPDWSPDGEQIAYVSNLSGVSEIYVMDADGSQLTPITPPEISGNDPYWSPDGLSIAFLSSRLPPGLYTIDSAGMTDPVLVWENADLTGMAWSPNGELFAVIIGDPEENSFDVYLYELDSGTTTRLTDTLYHNSGVDWFPSGNYLTFFSDLGGTDMDIYTMTTAGRWVTNITNNPAYDASPDWIP